MKQRILLLCAALGLAMAPAPVWATPRETPRIATLEANGIALSYRVHGNAKGRPLLLIAGTDMQLIEWPQALIDGLVAQGFRVITFDNRDAGESTHFTDAGSPDWGAIFAALGAGKTPPLAYTAADMAKDTLALLDGLGIARADIMGVSGGATIASLVALARPERVRTLSLIAANSGNPANPLPADPKRLASVPAPSATDGRDAILARRIATYKAIAGSRVALDEAELRRLADATIARDADPFGFARQGAAMIVLGDLRPRLAQIKAPAVVIHGEDDPLIALQSGREVAQAIPGAVFVPIPGMGHSLGETDIAMILDVVKTNTARAK